MIDFKEIEGMYFVGIGGIGMSALALYFSKGGYTIAGYDRSESRITQSLTGNGCLVAYEDDVNVLPSLFGDLSNRNRVIIIYTPAIPSENNILTFFKKNGYRLYKRSEVLGEISANTDTIAVAGTHGKTTVSTMIAHLLKQSEVDCSAFLGGISKNYDSNLLLGESRYTVMEADEFDRSFHHLKPLMAVVTSLDADHLDIYGDQATMIDAYNEFCRKIRPDGKLVVNSRISDRIIVPGNVECFTYGLDARADYYAFNIENRKDYYRFDLKTPTSVLRDLHFAFPGIINIENFTAAIAIADFCGVTEPEIRKAVILFQGVRRRFDIRINWPDLAYVDDYAHHPEEIKACIKSVKEYFTGRKITGIFQPHLFSRTRDHSDGFAEILDELDEAIILPVYPAREMPIEGVTSELIFNKMKSGRKRLLNKSDIPGKLYVPDLDVLLTIGAGDIDTLVAPIEEKLRKGESGMKKVLNIILIIPVLYIVIIPIYLTIYTNSGLCSGVEIDIRDSSEYHFVTKRQLINLVYGNSGNLLGKPIREVPVYGIENRINVLRELKTAEVYLTIDGTIHVYADQRDPVMRVIPDNGGDYFIDEEGFVIRKRNLYNPRLHIISGNVNISSKMLDGVSVLDTSIKNSILKDIYQLVNYLNDDKFWSAQIDQIYVDGNDEIDLIPRVGNQLVHLGTTENYEGKLRNLEAFYDKVLPEVGWNKYSLINLEYKDQIVCKKR